jgi:hypoxanthine-DNA glycosylase
MGRKSAVIMEYKQLTHTFDPIYDENSRILILGSFPSVKSREIDFYYGHPQNRYWKVLANILDVTLPETPEEKRKMLLEHNIAIWDVIHSCSIIGSSDSSIKDVVVNDFSEILKNSQVKTIFVNGGKAYELYRKYAENNTGIKAIKLPSTSPANAAWKLERLCEAWRNAILPELDGKYQGSEK